MIECPRMFVNLLFESYGSSMSCYFTLYYAEFVVKTNDGDLAIDKFDSQFYADMKLISIVEMHSTEIIFSPDDEY